MSTDAPPGARLLHVRLKAIGIGVMMCQSFVRSAVLSAIAFVLSSPAAIAGGDGGSIKDAPATSYRWDGVDIAGGSGGSWAKDRMRPGCANTLNIRSYDDGADAEYSD